jgi:hypothetical protein
MELSVFSVKQVCRKKPGEYIYDNYQKAQKQQKRPLAEAGDLFHEFGGVADGARTHDNRNHNPGLYQLSYSHH